MAFSCKIVLGEYLRDDGSRAVYVQAIIDRVRTKVSLGFYIKDQYFDASRQRMKSQHPNAKDFDTEFIQAIAKANTIASRYRIAGRALTPLAFRNEFRERTSDIDFIRFFRENLELKKPTLADNTHKSHTTVLNKLKEFRKSGIPFSQINLELMQRFRNHLIEKGNGVATIEKILKITKQYLSDARLKGIQVSPLELKIKTFKSNRNALTEDEVIQMTKYYDSTDCLESHRKVLRYFLFSCYTGVRISDIHILTWNNIHGEMLEYIPTKTKGNNEKVSVPLIEDLDMKFLPAYTHDNACLFDTYTDPASNRILKEVADKMKIRKKISYHTSRHTFGSLMAEGGDIVATQRMMGHSEIKTTMGYVHTNAKQLIDAKRMRFLKSKPVS